MADRSNTPNDDYGTLREGDLARIIKSEAFPESIGWVVEVRTRALVPWETGPGTYWWICHAQLGPVGLTQTRIPEDWLRRIPPLSELGDVETKEEIHA